MQRYEPGDIGRSLSDPAGPAVATQPAIVPGTVLTSLVANGAAPDPYFGVNRELLTDIGQVPGGVALYTYWFFNRFRLPSQLPPKGRLFLAFRGINYSAEVYLNSKLVASKLEGMFLRHRLDITDSVSLGADNVVAVLVTPPDPAGDPRANNPGPVTWPSVCQGGDKQLGRNVTAQFSGGWDFVLAVADRNAGIWDIVELVVTGPAVIDTDPRITTTIGQQQADVTAVVEVRNTTTEALQVEVQLDVGGNMNSTTVELPAGASVSVNVTVGVSQPELWWPHGHGAQPLYPTVVRVLADGLESDSYRCNTGLRTITSGLDSVTGGRYFEVNGRRIFIRGGAWTFPDAMLRHSAQDYDDQVHLHKLANLNMIRLWGGGIIERPEFYAACDRHGLLVWQEFPLSADCLYNATFPGQAPDDFQLFVDNCLDAVRMLRNHACLALWVGCNEGFNSPSGPPPEIDALLRAGIPPLDSTPYVSYSTDDSEGLGPGDGTYAILEPRKFFDLDRFSTPKTYPFNPEYGSVGLPVVESLRRFMPEQDLTDLDHILVKQDTFQNLNRSWYSHQLRPFFAGGTEFQTPDQILIYGRPTSIEGFCEMAQAAQHQQYKALFEALNALMWQRFTGGVLWRSAPGWTALNGCLYDRYLEPTGGLFGARQAGTMVNVQINLSTVANVSNFNVEVVNNTAEALPAGQRVVVTVCDEHGKRQAALSREFVTTGVAANSVAVVGSLKDVIDTSTLQVLRTKLVASDDTVLASNLDWIADTARTEAYKPLRNLTQVLLTASGTGRQSEDGVSTVTLNIHNTTDTLAFFNRVRVWQPDAQELLQPVFLTDNYFSLLPDEMTSIELRFRLPAGGQPTVSLTGWNSSPGTPGDVVPIQWGA